METLIIFNCWLLFFLGGKYEEKQIIIRVKIKPDYDTTLYELHRLDSWLKSSDK